MLFRCINIFYYEMDGSRDFICESLTCNHASNRYNNLLRHYRENPSHKPPSLCLRTQGRPSESADEVISSVFHDGLAPRKRLSRVKAFATKLTIQELKQHCLPRLCQSIKPWEFLLACAQTSRDEMKVGHVASCFIETRDALVQKYPELVSIIFNPSKNDEIDISQLSKQQVIEVIEKNKHLVCEWILSGQNEEVIFKDILMKRIYEQYKGVFLEVSCGIVGSLCISQRDTQDILRNTWGKKISEVLGFNIFPPKDNIVRCLNAKKEKLSEQVGLKFEEKSNGIVVATVNVQKYLEFLLSRPGMQGAINFPEGSMIIYQFTDLAPWLRWSRFSTGITSSRIKVVDPYNLHSLVITCGAYLGQDDYATLSNCFKGLYDQIQTLNEVNPFNTTPILIHKRAIADGKQRRIDTGNSSAKSTYPICDAPEHNTQLGDMSLCSKGPVWSVEDAKELSIQYQVWLKGRVDNKQNRREFAKTHLGNVGRQNLVGCDLADYYIGGLHLAMRSVESICNRIGQCATGMFNQKSVIIKLATLIRAHEQGEAGGNQTPLQKKI